jgi:hypothetical protein
MEQFKYLETTLTNQNSIQENINSKLKSGNTCYLSVQNILSYSLLFKNLSLKYTELYFGLVFCIGVKRGR